MTTREVLVEARKLIEAPEDWCAHEPALGSGKNFAVTALRRTSPLSFGDPYDLLVSLSHNPELSAFNDSHSHTEVLDLFDRAIEAAR